MGLQQVGVEASTTTCAPDAQQSLCELQLIACTGIPCSLDVSMEEADCRVIICGVQVAEPSMIV